MRLSEEILLGGMVAEHRSRANQNLKSDRTWGCALQLAQLARGDSLALGCYPAAAAAHPRLEEKGVTACPRCSTTRFSPITMVAHLNDAHKWSLAKIAQWVAAQELVEVAAPVPAQQPALCEAT